VLKRAHKDAPKEMLADLSGNILKVCAVMRKLAAEKKYDLVDFHSIVSKNTPLAGKNSYLRNPANTASNDGVHPTREGYAVLSKAVYDLIKAKGYSAEVTVCLGDSITFGSAMLGAGTSYGTSYPGQLAALLNGE
jgi:lysophospholipase L1-like esterase